MHNDFQPAFYPYDVLHNVTWPYVYIMYSEKRTHVQLKLETVKTFIANKLWL